MAINKLGTENLAGILSGKSSNPQEIEEKTDNYTLAFTDKDRLVTMDAATAKTITIPADATTAFLNGTKIDIANIGTGTLTVAGASGVTLNGSPTTLSQYEHIVIIKTATDNWMIQGTPTPPVQNYKSFSLFSSGM